MNERIKELAVQANIFANTSYIPDSNWSAARDQKFAELIVRECVEVCNSRVGNSDYNTGRMHCKSDIKEHFGIKEN